jgi:hypothetical protein
MISALDWTDRDLLRQMLRARLAQGATKKDSTFEEIWTQVCCPLIRGQETSDFLLDISMMRPRNLLKLFSYCRGIAVNMAHQTIEPDDIEKGFISYSNDILADADTELKDICHEAEGVLYKFLFEKRSYRKSELTKFLSDHNIPEDKREKVMEYLLYYGLFGVAAPDNSIMFIYDVGYDMRKLLAIVEKTSTATYYLNDALSPALHIKW